MRPGVAKNPTGELLMPDPSSCIFHWVELRASAVACSRKRTDDQQVEIMAIATQHIETNVEPRRRRWTVEEYHRATAAGAFRSDERLELIAGEIYEHMSPQRSHHTSGISALEEALRALLPAAHYIRIQSPLTLAPDSEPEPDLAMVTGSWRDYRESHPKTAVLVAEVSDTTLSSDRTIKASLYASVGIPEYWILNLNERLLEVHRDPAPSSSQPFGHGYRTILLLTETETVAPLYARNACIAVADLMP